MDGLRNMQRVAKCARNAAQDLRALSAAEGSTEFLDLANRFERLAEKIEDQERLRKVAGPVSGFGRRYGVDGLRPGDEFLGGRVPGPRLANQKSP